MARPLQELLQGLQQRRQRRRSGWAGGDAPGMRDMINPLDSQAMSDRSQGVDISSAMPPARLEARMAPREEPQEEPTGGAAVTAQLTQGGRNPFQTAAGSNAREQPTQEVQCEGGVCRPQGSAGGLDASQYGITLGPGERLLRVDGMAGGGVTGGATASAAPPTVSPAPAGPTASQAAADAFSGLQKSFAEMTSDPNGPSFAPLATSIMEQAIAFNTMANMAPDIASKHFYRKQGVMLGMEAINTMRAAVMQADERRRAAYAEKWQEARSKQLESGTLVGQLREAQEVLGGEMADFDPDYLAAVYVTNQRKLAGQEPYKPGEMESSPEFQAARSTAHANRIAGYAAQSAAASDWRRPFGSEEERAAGASMPWQAAALFYGSMPYQQARDEINRRFAPAYLRELGEINAALPEDRRLSPAELQDKARMGALALESYLYYSQQAPAQQQQQQEVAPMRRTSRGSRPSNPAPAPSWAGESNEDPFLPPAEQDPSFVPSRAMLLNRK